MSGLKGTRTRVLEQRSPFSGVVALTVSEDDEKVFQTLYAGASGYSLKKTPPAQLVECLQDVVNVGGPMSPSRRVPSSSRSSAAVAFHLKNIHAKLEVHSESKAVAKGLGNRILR